MHVITQKVQSSENIYKLPDSFAVVIEAESVVWMLVAVVAVLITSFPVFVVFSKVTTSFPWTIIVSFNLYKIKWF